MTETEPPRIPPFTEYPPGWTIQQIRDSFDLVDTTPAFEGAGKYLWAQQKWSEALAAFGQRMAISLAEAWDGDAAEAARSGIRRYLVSAEALTPCFGTVDQLISATASASATVRASLAGLPPPVPDDGNTFGHALSQAIQDEDEEAARALMRDYYVQEFTNADNSMPVLPRPVPVSHASDSADPSRVWVWQDPIRTPESPDASTPGPDPSKPESPGPADPNRTGTPTAPDPATNPPSTTPASTNPASASPASTNPASALPPSTTPGTTPAGTAPANTVPGTANPSVPREPGTVPPAAADVPKTALSPRSPRTPALSAPEITGKSTPEPARSVPGTPVPTTGARAQTTPSTRGVAGASGTPGIPGAGAARKSEDDPEHRIPDYLRSEANTRELLGAPPKRTSTGVLGAKYRAAQTKPPTPESPSAEAS
ncbi:hypothetical protein ACFVMC_30210 [Nocardia sp. NPDC127579]|uniref:hypothetical protein n=1 Tax=Nocardia sp. NPDC127579 TaxID=3345402 RepID=UPI003634CDFF